MPESPLNRYLRDLKKPEFEKDAAQRIAVDNLQRLYEEMLSQPRSSKSWWAKLRGSEQAITPIKGLYFWGGVGRGKTYLMDTFFEGLPFADKRRVHFHRFMQRVHQERKALRHQTDPLIIIADQWAKQTRIICFDEFVVNDVADAVIIAKLLDALFKRGVSLVATSNVEPLNLYKDGLQRDLFLPAIDLIYRHCEVLNIDSGIDYRLRFLDKAEIFFTPLGDTAKAGLEYAFKNLASDAGEANAVVEIEGRELVSQRLGEGVIWFEFVELCDGPRSQNDYIELARCFHSMLLSNIPSLGRLQEDQARRFINLVDVLYDHNVKLIISAATPAEQIYTGTKNAFEFQRTVSRLQEMQSHDYLALAHKT
jgi:cell division protein ZapE